MIGLTNQHSPQLIKRRELLEEQSESVERRIKLVLDELDELELYHRIDQYFAREAELLKIREVLGITDTGLLDAFLQFGFTASTAPAIEMTPFVFLARAAGTDDHEASAASVKAIHESQLSEFPSTLPVIVAWLERGPKQRLWHLWSCYIRSCLGSMLPSDRVRVQQRITDQALSVARASNSWNGVHQMQAEERQVLDAITGVIHDRFRTG